MAIFDPDKDIDKIEEIKKTLAFMQELLEAEFPRELNSSIVVLTLQNVKVQDKISGLLQVIRAKIDTAFHDGDEFD